MPGAKGWRVGSSKSPRKLGGVDVVVVDQPPSGSVFRASGVSEAPLRGEMGRQTSGGKLRSAGAEDQRTTHRTFPRPQLSILRGPGKKRPRRGKKERKRRGNDEKEGKKEEGE